MKIKKLDVMLANQIAAGEVVERPASVVKELLENSLDAGASEIHLQIEAGGSSLIRLSDNGCGVAKDDLPLAISRHATSKISTVNDLEGICTLGFRGEALASISSVSRFELSSKEQGATEAWRIKASGESVSQPSPCAHPQGTTTIVRDLFYNTPARRRFMRSERVESGHIDAMMKRLALSHFEVAFTFLQQQKKKWQLPRANTVEQKQARVALVCGESFVENTFAIDMNTCDSDSGMRLSGWVAKPTFSRTQADIQYFYVNGRAVRDKLIVHAVRQAFADVLYNKRHPAFVLYLEIDPKQVDVNAHPTKCEVRFRESRLVHDFIFRSLHRAIADLRPEHEMSPVVDISHSRCEETPQASNTAVNKELVFTTAPSDPVAVRGVSTLSVAQSQPSFSGVKQRHSPIQVHKVTQQLYAGHQQHDSKESVADTIPPLGYALCQLQGIYILAENAQGMVMVDMHAAHERICYERMKLAYEEKQLKSQPLLVPIECKLTEAEGDCVERHADMLASLGLVVRRMGPTLAVIQQVPELLRAKPVESLLSDIISDLLTFDESKRLQETLDAILGNMACKAAIKANHRLSRDEMNAILRDLEKTPRGGQCNHGRPSWVQFSIAELDAFFLRGR
jgi:DNA mismatch repair protein MutL